MHQDHDRFCDALHWVDRIDNKAFSLIVKLKDGTAFDSINQRWSFMPKTNVGLESS